jgi:hypothetical protein
MYKGVDSKKGKRNKSSYGIIALVSKPDKGLPIECGFDLMSVPFKCGQFPRQGLSGSSLLC